MSNSRVRTIASGAVQSLAAERRVHTCGRPLLRKKLGAGCARGANALQQRAHPCGRLGFSRHELKEIVSRSLDSLGNSQLVAARVCVPGSLASARAARGVVPAEHDEQERVLLLALVRVGLGGDHGGIEAGP